MLSAVGLDLKFAPLPEQPSQLFELFIAFLFNGCVLSSLCVCVRASMGYRNPSLTAFYFSINLC